MLPLIAVFLLFPAVTLGCGFLFAATADSTGLVSVLPLLAVLVLLAVGAVLAGRRLTRS